MRVEDAGMGLTLGHGGGSCMQMMMTTTMAGDVAAACGQERDGGGEHIMSGGVQGDGPRETMGAGYAAVCRAARAPSREVKMLFHGVRRGVRGSCFPFFLIFLAVMLPLRTQYTESGLRDYVGQLWRLTALKSRQEKKYEPTTFLQLSL
jgi:hypothetical protein